MIAISTKWPLLNDGVDLFQDCRAFRIILAGFLLPEFGPNERTSEAVGWEPEPVNVIDGTTKSRPRINATRIEFQVFGSIAPRQHAQSRRR